MTDRQQIERLARGMGWHKHEFLTNSLEWESVWAIYPKNGDGHVQVATMAWNPFQPGPQGWHDAGMVWEAMMQKGYQPCVNWLDGAGIQPTGYHASFFFPETRTFYDAYGCDSPPAAIAEAALKVWT